jgi:hypothetical protein
MLAAKTAGDGAMLAAKELHDLKKKGAILAKVCWHSSFLVAQLHRSQRKLCFLTLEWEEMLICMLHSAMMLLVFFMNTHIFITVLTSLPIIVQMALLADGTTGVPCRWHKGSPLQMAQRESLADGTKEVPCKTFISHQI